VPIARRTRRLALNELVAGALILYPTYMSRITGAFTTPERTLDELLDWRRETKARLPLWRQLLRLALRLGKRI
jgi:capsular polysaccharide export protein